MFALFFLSVFLKFSAVQSEIIPYNEHRIYPSRPEYLIIPKFSKNDAPSWAPGHGHSYIDLSRLRIYTDCDSYLPTCSNSTFELLMFEAPQDKPWMDYWDNHNFCCSKELVSSGDCLPEQLNKLIIPSNLPGAFIRSVTVQPGNIQTIHEDYSISHHDITSTGLYVVFMGVCTELEDPTSYPIIVDGHVVSMDPYGFLPADIFGNLPFFGALSIMYSIIGLAWLIVCALYSDQLLAIQIWISAVLGLGMIETTILFSHYLQWNDSGTPTFSITMIGLFFGVSKRALSRIVVTMAALGYGIIRPSLGEDMTRLMYLGGGYFLLSMLSTVVSNLPSVSQVATDPEYDILSLIVFFIGAIDTIFYIWIFTSINNLLTTLAARRQASKYILYRNFRGVLMVSLFFTFLWMLYGSVISLNDSKGVDSNWQDRWTVDALWELTYFVMFIIMAVMWAPTKNSQRYAYSIELSQLDEDLEWQNIVGKDSSTSSSTDNNTSNTKQKGNMLDKKRHGGSRDDDDDDDDMTVGFSSSSSSQQNDSRERDLDEEYGGRLRDENDPFQGGGALDPSMAISKRD